jgi:hypothetical protein
MKKPKNNPRHSKNPIKRPSCYQPDLFNLDLAPVPPFRGDKHNPRVIRAIKALLLGVVDRNDLDEIVGCRNAPELIAEFRRCGLEVPCQRTPKRDRDGFVTLVGGYYLTPLDRMLIEQWIKRTGAKV